MYEKLQIKWASTSPATSFICGEYNLLPIMGKVRFIRCAKSTCLYVIPIQTLQFWPLYQPAKWRRKPWKDSGTDTSLIGVVVSNHLNEMRNCLNKWANLANNSIFWKKTNLKRVKIRLMNESLFLVLNASLSLKSVLFKHILIYLSIW